MARFKKTIGFIALALVAAVLVTGCKSSSSGGGLPSQQYQISIAPADGLNAVLEQFTKAFVATCTKPDGSKTTCTAASDVTWSVVSGNATAVTGSPGSFKAGNWNSGGTFKVKAAYAGVSAEYDIAVLKIVRTEILPGSVALMVGASQAFVAICHSMEGLSGDCTAKVTWAADPGLEATTAPNIFLANGDAGVANVYEAPVKASFDIAMACTSIADPACVEPVAGKAIVTVGSGEVISIKITPEVGLVQGEQKWFKVLCYTTQGLPYDCTHSPNVTYDAGGDMVACDPLITDTLDAPYNNCFQMDYQGQYLGHSPVNPLVDAGGVFHVCGQYTCPVDMGGILPQQNSYVQATYVNPPEYGGLVYNDQAELHCRYMCHADLATPNPGGILELEDTQVSVNCFYTDFFNDDCSSRYLNYLDETTTFIPFITWDVSLGVPDFATAEVTSNNQLLLSAGHIPGPCGAAVVVEAEYFDDDDSPYATPTNPGDPYPLIIPLPGNLGPKPYVIGGLTPLAILNDDDLVTLEDIVWDPVWMDTLNYYDATCGYDLAGSGDPDVEGVYSCYDVYVHDLIELNPVAYDHGYLTVNVPSGYFSRDPLHADYCIDAFDADWTWDYPVDDCNPTYAAWPPTLLLPQPDNNAWVGMFQGGICGMSPPENYAYSNYVYYTDRDNAPTIIGGGLSSAIVTLNFIDHTRADWLTTSATIEINGGFYVNDPIWHPTGGIHRPALHPMTSEGGNWLSYYVQAGTCDVANPLNKCDQVIRVRCQDLQGNWSQCVNNRYFYPFVDMTPANWTLYFGNIWLVPPPAWDFIVLADPGFFISKDDGTGTARDVAPLTLAAGWARYLAGTPSRPLDVSDYKLVPEPVKFSWNDVFVIPSSVSPGGPGTCDTTNFAIIMVTRNPWYPFATDFESLPGAFVFFELCEL